MVQPISNLAVGAKVKSLNTKYNGVSIVWQVGHKADGRVKLISEKIITLKCFDAKEPDNPNSGRKNYGNNRYSQSNIDQWLNSAASVGNWYAAQHQYDAPPNDANVYSNHNEYDAEAGFLSNFEESFRNAILDTTIRVVKVSVDGGGYEDITRKVYLLSNTEVGLPNESGVAEGSKWDLFSDNNSRKAYPTAEAVSASEFTYPSLNASSPWVWWLRTPNAGSSHQARRVLTDGTLSGDFAYYGHRGVRPALELASGILVSDTPDTDGAYIINWTDWTERHEGGSTATLGIAAEGTGTKTAHGGGEAGVVVGAEGKCAVLEIIYVPLGTFWSLDWDAPDDSLEATVTARDRMELLRKSTFQTSQVLQNKSLYELAEIVLQDARLMPYEYIIDTALQNIVVPYSWFNPMPHREALRQIAEAGLAAAFQNREGKIQIESFLISGDEPVLEITEDDYFPPLRAPSRQDQMANEIIVDTQPLRPATTSEEVYRSNEPITIPGNSTKTITAFYNKTPVIEATASLDNPPADVSITEVTYYGWGASIKIQNTNAIDKQVIPYIEGKPLTVQNKERATARDEMSITENGALRFEFPANPLVQTLDQAQAIADALLASVKDSRRDIEVEWRGNPALLLGDHVSVKGEGYYVIRQELEWDGTLSARLTGRKA